MRRCVVYLKGQTAGITVALTEEEVGSLCSLDIPNKGYLGFKTFQTGENVLIKEECIETIWISEEQVG